MKRKVTLNNLLHNDRVVLVLSVLLAIVVWATVVYGPSNEEERTISGVPVTVALGEYATDTLNMRIVDNQHITASVKVYGRRSVVEQLTTQDILVTVDTSAIIAPGTYSGLSIKTIKNGQQTDYDIVAVTPSVTSLTCDVWTEAVFQVQTQTDKIVSVDETKYQIGTPMVSGDVVQDGTIKVTGPKTEIDAIRSVVAVVDNKASLSETKVFDGTLKALGADGKEVNIEHCAFEAETTTVKVTVPVLVYKKVELQYQLVNAPASYAASKNLVQFTPSYLELWGTETVIETFEASLNTLCTFDFDRLTAENLTQKLELPVPETLKILDGVETVTAKFNLGVIRSKKLDVQLTQTNVKVLNCPDGYTVKPVESTLKNIVFYGPANAIQQIRAKDVQITVDLNNETTTGQRSLACRVSVPQYPGVWVYYGDTTGGYTLLATVESAG